MNALTSLSLLIACLASSAVAFGQHTANPLDELPSYIRKINDWGQRADFSHDGKRILFIEKTYGDAFELNLASGKITPVTHHYYHGGYTRALYLANGDILLSGCTAFDADNPHVNRYNKAELWVLDKSLTKPPVRLGARCFEGPAVSRKNLRIAWTTEYRQFPDTYADGELRVHVADIVYRNGTPDLTDRRLVLSNMTNEFLARPMSIETQNFVAPDETQITMSIYGAGTVALVDLGTGKISRVSTMEQLLLNEMRRHDDPYRFTGQPNDSPSLQVKTDTPVKAEKPKEPQTAPYDGSWESLQKMPVPTWFDDGKIGIFIHWGPYSVIGYKKGDAGYAEHVPKLLYDDSEHYYPYMRKRWRGNPPEFGYKDIIPEFKAENWDPEKWAALFAEVGARYVVLTAEHHDGWANWGSDLTPWNAVDMGPKRDLVGDLGKAVRRHGLKYAPSYHRERHTGFFANDKYVVHSEPRPDIAEEIRRVPEAASLYGPFSYDKAFVDDYVARWKEIQEKYHPDFLWIDDVPIFTRDGNRAAAGRFKPEIQYFYDQFRRMITDFMNDAAARGQEVYLNNKGANRNWPEGIGCLEKDNLKLKVIGPKWQSCTTFGSSFGYLAAEEATDQRARKSVERVIHEMVEVISRNGNFLINIGPRADGSIPKWQVERLRAMGDWLAINGAAIYGSRYWKENVQENESLSFTTNGKTLYAIKRAEPTKSFTIEATAGWSADTIQSVRLLGSDTKVAWRMTPGGLTVTPPDDLGSSRYAWSFEIVTNQQQHHSDAMEADADKALKRTGRVDLEGNEKRTD